jgi:hypothetical protein
MCNDLGSKPCLGRRGLGGNLGSRSGFAVSLGGLGHSGVVRRRSLGRLDYGTFLSGHNGAAATTAVVGGGAATAVADLFAARSGLATSGLAAAVALEALEATASIGVSRHAQAHGNHSSHQANTYQIIHRIISLFGLPRDGSFRAPRWFRRLSASRQTVWFVPSTQRGLPNRHALTKLRHSPPGVNYRPYNPPKRKKPGSRGYQALWTSQSRSGKLNARRRTFGGQISNRRRVRKPVRSRPSWHGDGPRNHNASSWGSKERPLRSRWAQLRSKERLLQRRGQPQRKERARKEQLLRKGRRAQLRSKRARSKRPSCHNHGACHQTAWR